jgi:hypothetical protein
MKNVDTYFDIDSVFTITKCEVIADMVRERNQLLYLLEQECEYDKIPDYTDVDRIKNEIFKKLDEIKNNAPIDFILEVLDEVGYGVSIVNNDNGMWGIVDTEICGVTVDNELCDYSSTVFMLGENFRDTLREAVINYLERIQINAL